MVYHIIPLYKSFGVLYLSLLLLGVTDYSGEVLAHDTRRERKSASIKEIVDCGQPKHSFVVYFKSWIKASEIRIRKRTSRTHWINWSVNITRKIQLIFPHCLSACRVDKFYWYNPLNISPWTRPSLCLHMYKCRSRNIRLSLNAMFYSFRY